jgi:hypothetical protein
MSMYSIGPRTKGPAPYSVVRRIIEWETGFPGHSVSKSTSQGRPEVCGVESEAFTRCLSGLSASALAGVEGEHTPANTQGAGAPETANPPKAREIPESMAEHEGLYIRSVSASNCNDGGYEDA